MRVNKNKTNSQVAFLSKLHFECYCISYPGYNGYSVRIVLELLCIFLYTIVLEFQPSSLKTYEFFKTF